MQPLNLKRQSNSRLLLFIGCIVFHVLGTWNLPLIDRDEPRFAEASREMRERHDYIVPYFNGQHRFDKPPLTYWAQAASYSVLGENDFAARFPTAIAAGLTALVILAWGIKLAGLRIGWAAAILFTLSLQTFLHGKAAVADMWLVLFMTTGFWAGLEWTEGLSNEPSCNRPPIPRVAASWLWFVLSLALAFLAKGPIGFIPLIPVIWIGVGHRRTNILVWSGLALLGAAAIICSWAVPALIRTDGEFFRVGIGRHVVARSIGAMEGHGAKSLAVYLLLLPFYFVTVFISFFPWSVKLPWLVRRVRKQQDPTDVYLIIGILSVFGIFTFVATKLPHYTLPAFPLLSLLLARHWLKGETFRTFRWVASSAAATWIMIALVVPPLVARFFPSYALFQRARDYLRPEMELASVGYAEPSIVWYFRSRLKGFLVPATNKNFREFMATPGPRAIILGGEGERVTPTGQHWRSFRASGFNIPKGRKVDLVLLLKADERPNN